MQPKTKYFVLLEIYNYFVRNSQHSIDIVMISMSKRLGKDASSHQHLVRSTDEKCILSFGKPSIHICFSILYNYRAQIIYIQLFICLGILLLIYDSFIKNSIITMETIELPCYTSGNQRNHLFCMELCPSRRPCLV